MAALAGADSRPRRRAVVGGLAVAVLVCTAWITARPPRPVEPTADVYTHLMVARHLVRGDGFLTDLAYPLSFAWPFARRLPQPLVHRPPGFGLLLTGPVALTGADPDHAVTAVRGLQLLICAGTVWLGAAAWFTRGRPGAAVGWAVLLAAHPLAAYAVDWGHDELAAALILFACWLRHRDGARSPNAGDGLLLGGLALLRPELVWLPVLWWLLRRPRRPAARAVATAALAGLLIAGPWAVRNARVTGNPFFSLQAYAEHVKDTRTFPDYTVYRQLEPQPPLQTLREDSGPVLRKYGRGLRFFWREQASFLPAVVTIALLGCGRQRAVRWLLRPRPRAGRAQATAVDALGLVGLSLLLVAGLYAIFDHSVRHLEVLLPLAAWELGPFLAERPWSLIARRRGRGDARPLQGWLAGGIAALVGYAFVRLAVAPPTGWDEASAAARDAGPMVAQETEALRAAPPGLLFVRTAAAPWRADRPAVWDPLDESVRARIRILMEKEP